jgi:hypothetical protein
LPGDFPDESLAAATVQGQALRVWNWTVKQALRPIPMTWPGCCFVAAFMIAAIGLFQDFPRRPVPGLAIGLLGAEAVVVAVRTEHLTLGTQDTTTER